MAHLIGIDVGGTSIKAGLFTDGGELIAETKIPTGALDNAAEFKKVTDGLHAMIETKSVPTSDVVGVGLDIPGPVDAAGNVGLLANITMDPTAFKAAILASFPSAQLAFINDANAAALGEAWVGAGKGVDNFVMLALGTGVGGGIVSNGQLIAGNVGAGGEVGHITVRLDEPETCGCGRHGCLEQYSSASGIVRLYKQECAALGVEPAELSGPTDSLTVFNELAAGSQAAKNAISLMCEYLGFGMAQLSCVVDPEVFIIGGGVVGSFDVFKDELAAKFREFALTPCANTRIIAAELGNQAAIYGSAYSVLQML